MKALQHLSRLSAGFIAVLVGYSSSAVLIFQAASVAGASTAEISSWLWALGIGMGLSSIGLSLYYRMPILMAWSTPGAALLISALSGLSLAEAIGSFLCCSLLIAVCGLTGLFEKLMHHVPTSLASAMLAGILLPFGLDVFRAFDTQPLLVGLMLMSYLVSLQLARRYAVPISLAVGLAIAGYQGLLPQQALELRLALPVFTVPAFSLSAIIGVSLPLFVVTMASQNVPGIATLRANGYHPPVSPLISCTGLLGVILAPFGGFTFNLAAITAAICMGEDADRDPEQRYWATVSAGVFYLLAGIFGAAIVSLFAVFPQALIMAIAGLALLATIGNSLSTSLRDADSRDAALLTFVITASSVSWLGIGSAFWGLVVGLLALHGHKLAGTVMRRRRQPDAPR